MFFCQAGSLEFFAGISREWASRGHSALLCFANPRHWGSPRPYRPPHRRGRGPQVGPPSFFGAFGRRTGKLMKRSAAGILTFKPAVADRYQTHIHGEAEVVAL